MLNMSYDLHGSIGYLLTYAARLSERRFEQALSQICLTRLMWCVLCALEYERLTRPSDIAAFIGVNRTAISRVLTRMEAEDLLVRQVSEGDGRARMIVVTERGRAALEPATAAAKENARYWGDKLTGGDRVALRRVLDNLIEDSDEPLQGL